VVGYQAAPERSEVGVGVDGDDAIAAEVSEQRAEQVR
jgi:hypothetical protein